MNQYRIMLLGGSGQLGSELLPLIRKMGKVDAPSRREVDAEDASMVLASLKSLKPELIINAAAYTAVDLAETYCDRALRLNAKLPALLAAWSAENGCRLVHYSSDYTLAGTGDSPQDEAKDMKPLSWYGRTKADGDIAINKSGAHALILRTSWVYSTHHHNFFRRIIELSRQRTLLKVIDDQIGVPTPADWLAKTTVRLLQTPIESLPANINCVPSGFVSWYGFATKIIEELRARNVAILTTNIEPISSDDLQQPAQRPKNSRLDNTKLKNILGECPEHWEELFTPVIGAYLPALINQSK